jgi:hypothetical protein
MKEHKIQEFSWKFNTGTVEASDLGPNWYGDIGGGKKGFSVKGLKETIIFSLKRTVRDADNDIACWEFTGNGNVIKVFND